MVDWSIREEGYDKEKIAQLGSRFLIGNGYMGIRGTLEEYTKEYLPAVNMAGLYDRMGEGWREPVNAPNGCYTYLRVDGEAYRLPDRTPTSHGIELDYRYGIWKRHTTWHTPRGNVTFISERFASMDKVNTIGMRFRITADFHADIELVTGIDCEIWNLNGEHLERVCLEEAAENLYVCAQTQEKKVQIAVAEGIVAQFPKEVKTARKDGKIYHRLFFITNPGIPYEVEKWTAVYTGKECADPVGCAVACIEDRKRAGYERQMKSHKKKWESLWETSQIILKGDDAAMEALNYSMYHLHSIAPRHQASLSIPARGLSGQTYKGAVFWDTEMFMLDFFLFTDPDTAKSLLRYRIDTLEGALDKAKAYGFQGAFYAWESQEGGYDACTDYNVTDVFTKRPMRTYFRDKQVHISAAVVYGIMRYVRLTGDDSLLRDGGLRTIAECARFYYSLLLKPLSKTAYELRDVIGPDEYHERVNNNGYTNRMAKYVWEQAASVLKDAGRSDLEQVKLLEKEEGMSAALLAARFLDAAEGITIPKPDSDGIIEQFDGYFALEDVSLQEVKGRLIQEKEYWGGAYGVASQTQIIKQADVVTWLNLFYKEFPENILRANWEYYEPRTEHGSSLSACMYAMLACRLGMPEKAYPFFMKSAMADLKGGGKEWAGLVYIGGTHPAAAGGAYMTAVEGFAGIEYGEDGISCTPHLPKHWKEMLFHVIYRGKEYEIHINQEYGGRETEDGRDGGKPSCKVEIRECGEATVLCG